MEEDDNYKKLIKMVNVMSDQISLIDPTDQIKDILDSGFDINYVLPIDCKEKKWQGCSAFHLVLDEVSPNFIPKVIDLLISYGADFSCQDHNGYTPLSSLFQMTNIICYETLSWEYLDKLLPILLESKNSKNPRCKDGISHFHIACACGNLKVVDFFLKAGVPVNEAISSESRLLPGYTPLHIAVRNKDRKMVQLLLEHGADLSCVNADSEFPLQLIFHKKLRGNLFRRKELLHFECDRIKNRFVLNVISGPNEDESYLCSYIGFNKLHKFCIEKHDAGDIDDFEKLLNLSNVNSHVNFDSLLWPGFTALHFAVQNDLEIVMQLLKNGANPLAKDASGTTPLDICCQQYGLRTVGIILATRNELGSIKLRDGNKLVDVITTLDSINKLRDYLNTTDVNNGIPVDSHLWPGYSLLHLAVLTSDGNLVKLCLEYGADYRMTDAKNMTALHLAFRLNNRDCINSILEAHDIISANPVNSNNLSHFHIACITGNASVAGKFLQFGVDPNARTSVGYIMKKCSHSEDDTKIPAGSTAFHIAAAVKSEDLLKLLVKSTADPNLCDAEGFTWVHRVSFQRTPATTPLYKYLWKHPEALRSNPIAPGGLSHLHIACFASDIQAVKALLPLTENINLPVTSELKGYIEQVFCDVDTYFNFMNMWLLVGDTPLLLAVQSVSCTVELVDLLFEHGADVMAKNYQGRNAVHVCYQTQRYNTDNTSLSNVLKRLILELQKKEKSSDGLTAMHYASASKDISLLTKFIEEGKDFNSQIDPDSQIWPGHSPLSLLVKYECIEPDFPLEYESIKLFLQYFLEKFENSISVNESAALRTQELVISKEGLTAFHVCCMGSDADMVEKFIKAGVDINVQINSTSTPWKGYSNYAKAGYTPVHHAVEYGSESVLEVLLQHGADVDIEDVQGRTPMQLAAEVRFDRLNILLRFCNIDGNMKLALMDSLVKNENMRAQDCVNLLVFDSPIDTDILAKLCTYMRSWARKLYQPEFEIVINCIPKNIFNRLLKFKDSCGCNIIHHLVSKKLYLSNENIGQENYTTFVKEFSNKVEKLLSKDCDLDHQDVNGQTPLHYAIITKQVVTVEMLLRIGSDINVADNNGITPYMYCYQEDLWTGDDKKEWRSLHKKIRLLFNTHVDRLRTAGLYLNEANEECYQKIFGSVNNAAHANILKELAQMEIRESLSLRSLLTEKLISVFPVMPLDDRRMILRCLKLNRLHKMLPEWSGLFKLQHRKILKNVKLFKPALKALRDLLDPRLPDHCLESILTHLNVCDWRSLRELKMK